MATGAGAGRKQVFTREEVRLLGEDLRALAAEWEAVTYKMNSDKIEEVEIDGGKNAGKSVKDLWTMLNKIDGARRNALRPSGK